MTRSKKSEEWDGSVVCGTAMVSHARDVIAGTPLDSIASEVITSPSRSYTTGTPSRAFNLPALRGLIADHVKVSHPRSGTMATTWNVCDGCNVFLVLLDEAERDV